MHLSAQMGTEANQLGESSGAVGATDSCRVDFLSASFFASSNSLQRQQISYFLELVHFLSGTHDLHPGGGRRFFEESWFHPCGVGLKWTEPSSGQVNQGLLSVDLKGDALASIEPSARKAVYLDMYEMEGFKQATRIDTQRTLVNPLATAQEVLRRVQEKEVWIKGFPGYRSSGLLDADGRPINGCTVSFGSPKGTTQVKTYDKRAEMGGEGPPAVRHELMQRKQSARDRFTSLCLGLKEEGDTGDSRYETHFVQSNLAQHMTYLDTSRLKDLSKDQWPDNWARDSKPADFWNEVVTGDVEEFQTKWRFERSLERLIKNRAKQYGRGRCKWMALRMFRDGEEQFDVLQDDLDLDFVRLKDEDIDEVVAQVPEERRQQCIEWMRSCRAIAAKNVEGAHNAL